MNLLQPRHRLLLWLVLGLLQVSVPASMVWRSERIQKTGQAYHFQLSPYDPTDPFRGRFLNLRFAVETKTYKAPVGYEDAPELFLSLETDAEGLAFATALSLERPPKGDYLRLKQGQWSPSFTDTKQLHVTLPFHRYYVNEGRAPEIEKEANRLLRADTPSGKQPNLYAIVRVADGEGSLISLQGPAGELK